MKSMSHYQIYSYLALRRAVGWIGILLPFVLMAGDLIIFGDRTIRRNISLYYHSGMRDVFVGALCAIALFLFFYRGYNKWDNITASLAGLFALGIAFFPTNKTGSADFIAWIHFICAGLFFVILACISLFLFTRKDDNPTRRKLTRNKIYIICGIVMLAALAALLLYFLFFDKTHQESTFIFWSETVALIAFGTSWLTKGGTLYPDKETKQS